MEGKVQRKFYIGIRDWNRLVELARKRKISRSALLREIVANYLWLHRPRADA